MSKTHLKIIKITKVHGCHMAPMKNKFKLMNKFNYIHKRGIWEKNGVDAFSWELKDLSFYQGLVGRRFVPLKYVFVGGVRS